METVANQRILPQLVMIRGDLLTLPSLRLPPGYSIRPFRTGDEESWETIINEAFENKYNFDQLIRSNDYFLPDRVLFACFGNVPIATATAWFTPKWKEIGYLHMVGCLKAHRGKGLGLQTSLAAMKRMADEGKESVILQTDDFRLAAIRTYLRLGFRPLIVHENQMERWTRLLDILGCDKGLIIPASEKEF